VQIIILVAALMKDEGIYSMEKIYGQKGTKVVFYGIT